MSTIFHLSFPVENLDEAVTFYIERLGATVGRRTTAFADVFLFGVQVTLQNDWPSLAVPMPRSWHFGATLTWGEWEALLEKLKDVDIIVEGPSHKYLGQPVEQAKFMIADPSGNLIELKAYRNPEAVLGALGEPLQS